MDDKYCLVIAEKPSLARSIADAIPGSASGKDPIFKGDFCITWLYGHVMTLKEPQAYDEKYKEWNLEQLPIYFPNWEQVPSEGKRDKVTQIGKLLRNAKMVIHAGDPDDEGQLLVDEVLRWHQYSGPVKRLDTANTTKEALMRALRSMQDNKSREIDGMAAFARSVADLMVGVNMTRFFTCSSGGKTLTVGRVQTPTLGLVVERDLAIEAHKKTIYYVIEGTLNIEGKAVPYSIKFAEDDSRLTDGFLLDKDEGEKICTILREKAIDRIAVTHKKQTQAPPLPFNLVKLQTYCGNKWGYDPQRVMAITQELKDSGYITYNRSDCQYLSEDHYKEAPKTISETCKVMGLDANSFNPSIKSSAFNDKNITAHFAIIPTGKYVDLSSLSTPNRNVYEIIAKYYLVQFMPSCIKDVVSLKAEVPGVGAIVSTTTVIKDEGFYKFLPSEFSKPSPLAELTAGVHSGTVESAAPCEKETKAPSRYTKTSLNEDMTRIARYVKDPTVKALLLEKDKDKKGENGSIGTSATRASIIDGLVSRGYLEEKGKKLISTPLGREFYALLPNEIKKPDMTAYWWVIQEKIKAGEVPYTALEESVLETINSIISRKFSVVASAGRTAHKVLGKCPRCRSAVIEGKRGYGCSNYKNGCKFTLWKESKIPIFSKFTITPSMATRLLDGKTITVPLYSPEKDVQYSGKIRMEDSFSDFGADLKIVRDDTASSAGTGEKTSSAEAIATCPWCGGNVIEGRKAFGCENNLKGECNFVLWKNPAIKVLKNITISKQHAKTLIAGGTLISNSLYSPNKNTTFRGGVRLVLDNKDSKYGPGFKLVSNQELMESQEAVEALSLGQCPRCGHHVVESQFAYVCSNTEGHCKFKLNKTAKSGVFSKTAISSSQAKQLLEGKDVGIETLYSEKSGKKFYGVVRLRDSGEDVGAGLEIVTLDKVVGTCTLCGGDILETPKAFSCRSDGCGFVVWKEQKGMLKEVKITAQSMKTLLGGKSVHCKMLYSPKKETYFEGDILLQTNKDENKVQLCLDGATIGDSRKPLGKCPICGSDVFEYPKLFKCSDEECSFAIWKRTERGIFKDIVFDRDKVSRLLDGKTVVSSKLYSSKHQKNYHGGFCLRMALAPGDKNLFEFVSVSRTTRNT